MTSLREHMFFAGEIATQLIENPETNERYDVEYAHLKRVFDRIHKWFRDTEILDAEFPPSPSAPLTEDEENMLNYLIDSNDGEIPILPAIPVDSSIVIHQKKLDQEVRSAWFMRRPGNSGLLVQMSPFSSEYDRNKLEVCFQHFTHARGKHTADSSPEALVMEFVRKGDRLELSSFTTFDETNDDVTNGRIEVASNYYGDWSIKRWVRSTGSR